MNAMLESRCQLLIDNRTAVNTVYPWESNLQIICAAAIYAMQGKHVDPEQLRRSKELLKQRVGVFNNFRGTAAISMAVMMDLSGDPEGMLDKALRVYDMLKTHFMTSSYLPMCAMIIASSVPESRFDELAAETRSIFERMQKEHPFLTGYEDCTYCTMLALTGRPQDQLIEDMETTFQLLKPTFFAGNALQSLSHALALHPDVPKAKVDRVVALYDSFKNAKQKWGVSYELPLLGTLAMAADDLSDVTAQVLEAESWLKTQKGFGFWSMDRTYRLMYAGMLMQSTLTEDTAASANASVTATISTIIAQQTALCATIAASSAVHASTSSH